MKGTILDFDKKDQTGIISGDDGKRYSIHLEDWKTKNTLPKKHMRVDFLVNSGLAVEIYEDLEVMDDSTSKSLSDNFYTSKDDFVFMGVCGGLGHRFGIQSNFLRFLVAAACFFSGFGLLVYIAAGLIFESQPTKS